MTSDEIRAEALAMLYRTIPHPDAVRFTFMQVMAMIEREGYAIPRDGESFLKGRSHLVRVN